MYFFFSSTSSVVGASTLATLWSAPHPDSSERKRPFEESPSSSGMSSLSHLDKKRWQAAQKPPPTQAQLTLLGTRHDPQSTDRMDIAVADFIFSNALSINLVECTKLSS